MCRFDPKRNEMFDGEIGLWPLTETYAAQRSSVHHKKGAFCVPNVASLDRCLCKHYITLLIKVGAIFLI